MNIEILAFGIAKDIIGTSKLSLVVDEGVDVASVRGMLLKKYPSFEKLASLRVAVNTEYVDDMFVLNEKDEIVLIPPVSGG